MITKQRGFTLIELMISILIMAAMTTIVSIAIRSSVKNKKKLEYRITNQAHIYDAIRIIRADVEQAFHYQDFFYDIEKKAITEMNEELKRKSRGQQTPEQVQVPPQPKQLTQFAGEANELHFTSLNNFRTKYNAQESDQMEVGYYLSGCTSRDSQRSTRCLYRRTDPYIDDDVTEGGRKMMVAENVTQLEFAYRSDDENAEWVSQWRSDNKGRADHQNKFPHQVRMKIAVEDKENPDATALKEVVIMNIHFPNNLRLFQDKPQNGQQQITN